MKQIYYGDTSIKNDLTILTRECKNLNCDGQSGVQVENLPGFRRQIIHPGTRARHIQEGVL